MGMLDRVGSMMEQRFDELYSSANMNRMFDKIMDSLPEELREGLSQLFNMLSGADDERTNETSVEYQAIGELYGAGGAKNDGVRMAANFAQRDDANFASGVTIGTGMGAITEVNGIQYVNGKAMNDANEDEGVELMSEMDDNDSRQSELREWQQSTHRLGNVEMTGEEWAEFADMLSKDSPARRALIEDIKKREGANDTDAQKKADQIALYARMQSLPKSQWTPEMKALDAELNADPENKEKYIGYIERNKAERDRSYGHENATERLAANSASQDVSASARDNAFSTQFPTAPPVKANFQDAASPQPAEKPAIAVQQPTLAQAPPMPAANAGFDV